ncbi:hypothetical protein FQA39_LY05947 [Lamprigera yunnana]|nr:hypothetical protein FQA39_LY05947 [Lamprigera yunnana]
MGNCHCLKSPKNEELRPDLTDHVSYRRTKDEPLVCSANVISVPLRRGFLNEIVAESNSNVAVPRHPLDTNCTFNSGKAKSVARHLYDMTFYDNNVVIWIMLFTVPLG